MTHKKQVAAAVDVGYGITKAITAEGSALLASIVGPAVDVGYSTTLAGVTRGCRVSIDNRDLFVGELARLQSPSPQRPQSRARSLDIVKTLALAALLEADARGTIDHLTTGLPVEWYKDHAALSTALTGKHDLVYNGNSLSLEIKEVKVLPQPVGAIFDAIVTPAGRLTDPRGLTAGRVAVIDVGNGTTDLALMDSLNYIGKSSQSVTTATAGTLKKALAAAIREKYKIEYTEVAMDSILEDRAIVLWGKTIPIDDLIDTAAAAAAFDIIGKAQSLWKMRKTFSTVICCGGVMPLLFETIKEALPSASMPAEPQLANVRGFYKRGLLRAR